MSTAIGLQAEQAAAAHLTALGYKIIARNWRTRWCEIDIIAEKHRVVYFIEVKYRSNNHFGSAIEYITPKKQQQIRFAAAFWLAAHDAKDARIAGIALSGPNFQVDDLVFIDD